MTTTPRSRRPRRPFIARPRVLPAGAPRIRLRAPAYSRTRINAATIALAFAFGFLALVYEPVWIRPTMLAFAVVFVVLGFGLRGMMEAVEDGLVRVAGSDGGTRWVPTWLVTAAPWVAGALLLLPALITVLGWPPATPLPSVYRISRWAPFVFAALGLFVLAREAHWLRTPRGLLLTAAGLTGIRGARRIDLGWDDVLGVGVIDARRAFLAIRTTSGLLKVEPYAIGSDPNVVAPIVRHYLTHPEDRHLLADPVAAIRRVEEAVSAQT
jgi:hypothetical protein